MDSSDIKFEDAGSCLACVAEAQGSIDAAFALLNDPVVKPEDAVKAAALLQHSLKVVAVAQRLLHDSRLGGVSIGPDVPTPGIPPPFFRRHHVYVSADLHLFTPSSQVLLVSA